MKLLLSLLLTSILTMGYFHISKPVAISSEEARLNVIRYKKLFTISCAVNIAAFNPDDSANIIPLLDGWGKYRMPVTENNDSAYIYFQQGINMYYGFILLRHWLRLTRAQNLIAVLQWAIGEKL